jgi:hypothetical protein
MATINIAITAPDSEFLQFANELGYQTEVLKSEEELALLVEPISIQDRLKPNPQTRVQFLQEYFKNVVSNELYRQKAIVIDREVNDAKEAEKTALKNTIRNIVAVTVQA